MKPAQIIPALFLLGIFSAGYAVGETKVRGDVSIYFDSSRPQHRPMYRHQPPQHHRPPPVVIHRPLGYRHAPAPVYVERRPIIIERAPTMPPPPSVSRTQGEHWFYCAQSQAYYPYVNSCPAGWMKVVPQTPS